MTDSQHRREAYFGASEMSSICPAGRSVRRVTDPAGHLTVIAETRSDLPNPKCNRWLELHPYPDHAATRSHCFPAGVSSSTQAPTASRFDLLPHMSNPIQLPAPAVRFQRTCAGSFRRVTTRSTFPSRSKSPQATPRWKAVPGSVRPAKDVLRFVRTRFGCFD